MVPTHNNHIWYIVSYKSKREGAMNSTESLTFSPGVELTREQYIQIEFALKNTYNRRRKPAIRSMRTYWYTVLFTNNFTGTEHTSFDAPDIRHSPKELLMRIGGESLPKEPFLQMLATTASHALMRDFDHICSPSCHEFVLLIEDLRSLGYKDLNAHTEALTYQTAIDLDRLNAVENTLKNVEDNKKATLDAIIISNSTEKIHIQNQYNFVYKQLNELVEYIKIEQMYATCARPPPVRVHVGSADEALGILSAQAGVPIPCNEEDAMQAYRALEFARASQFDLRAVSVWGATRHTYDLLADYYACYSATMQYYKRHKFKVGTFFKARRPYWHCVEDARWVFTSQSPPSTDRLSSLSLCLRRVSEAFNVLYENFFRVAQNEYMEHLRAAVRDVILNSLPSAEADTRVSSLPTHSEALRRVVNDASDADEWLLAPLKTLYRLLVTVAGLADGPAFPIVGPRSWEAAVAYFRTAQLTEGASNEIVDAFRPVRTIMHAWGRLNTCGLIKPLAPIMHVSTMYDDIMSSAERDAWIYADLMEPTKRFNVVYFLLACKVSFVAANLVGNPPADFCYAWARCGAEGELVWRGTYSPDQPLYDGTFHSHHTDETMCDVLTHAHHHVPIDERPVQGAVVLLYGGRYGGALVDWFIAHLENVRYDAL